VRLLEVEVTAMFEESTRAQSQDTGCSVPRHWLLSPKTLAGMQDSKKIKSEEPYFELLTTELCATEDRVFNVSRFLPSIRFV